MNGLMDSISPGSIKVSTSSESSTREMSKVARLVCVIFSLHIYVSPVLLETPDPPSAIFLHSQKITDFGIWGKLEECPLGEVVVGMQLKVETKGKGLDETALNGIKFFCSKPRVNRAEIPLSSYKTIHSSIGAFGHWRETFECNGIATGFQLRSDVPKGIVGDDTAANNLRLFCSDLNGGYLEGDGTTWGNWTEPQMCSKGKAICGLQTQVEEDKGPLADDSALNNIGVKCCLTK